MTRRLLTLLALLATLLCADVAAGATPSVEVPGSDSTIRVDAAIGELEDATVVVRGAAGRLSVRVDESSAPLLTPGFTALRLDSTSVGGKQVADPLPPLTRRATIADDAPVTLVLRFRVPEGTQAGLYTGGLVFEIDATPFATVPVQLRVFGVELPARDDPKAFRTLFLLSPQTYVAEVVRRTGSDSMRVGPAVTDRLYAFLSDYRVSPGDWGFGTPWPDGYEDRTGWSRAAATRMAAEAAPPFRTMRLPLPTQRAGSSWTGQAARAPDTWAAYLREQVLPFWRTHGWLDRALVWGWDESGPVYDRRYVAPQACASHAAGVPYLTTGAPMRKIPARRVTIPWGQGTRRVTLRAHGTDNSFLWDGKGCDDVDVWAVLSRRFYGSFATPAERTGKVDVQHELNGAIQAAKAHGASIWSFTYEAGLGSPGYAATDPPTDARVLGLWNALEGIDGTLYGDGMTSYAGSDPYQSLAKQGQGVLVYPALASDDEPVSSLRLESLRDGIEDADLARMVVAQKGRAALLAILAGERIFSIRGGRLLLGCTSGCDLRTSTRYSWPVYRRDAGTAAALERVHTALLEALAPAPA